MATRKHYNFRKRREVGVAARDGLERERARAFGVKFPEILEQLGTVLDVKEVKPPAQERSEPSGPAALVPEINDVERAAALDVGQRGVDGLRPGRDHRKRIGKERRIEGSIELKGLRVIEFLGEAARQRDGRLQLMRLHFCRGGGEHFVGGIEAETAHIRPPAREPDQIARGCRSRSRARGRRAGDPSRAAGGSRPSR